MSKKEILRVAIIVSLVLVVMAAGMFVTNDYIFSIKNFVVGVLSTIFIACAGVCMSILTDGIISILPNELTNEDISEIPTKSVDELEDSLSLENFIEPMSDDEFYLFLSVDRYGAEKPDKEAILNLLEQIKGNPKYESKEKIIYKKLQQIRG